MIIFDSLKWSNWFSYGDGNKITFTDNRVTQLIGKVGAGKSSIPLIIQEVLYSKNSKGIKKGDIRNRQSSDNVFAEIQFRVDEDMYVLLVVRKSSIKVQLYKNGIDISEHTAQATYKLIEEILGLDFGLFSQLTYQSSKTSLEFLTATDTHRKRFLISLFGLDKYVQIFEGYKIAIKSIEQEVSTIDGSISTILQFIDKHEGLELVQQETVAIPEYPEDLNKRKEELIEEILNVEATNKLISKNIQYKEILEKLDREKLSPPIKDKKQIDIEKEQKNDLLADKRHLEEQLRSIGILKDICHVCSQSIDNSDKKKLVLEYKSKIQSINEQVEELDILLQEAKLIDDMWNSYIEATREFEQLTNYIDPMLADCVSSKENLTLELFNLNADIVEILKTINIVIDKNKKVEANNAKVKVIEEQLEFYKEDLNKYKLAADTMSKFLYDLNILKDIFSTKGLVSYKIQYLVYDLQVEISKYLEQLSSGRFALEFKLVADKLNIVIYDGEYPINIEALSSGELAKINIATLLAIRSIMSSISNTKLNILFLDESINTLDIESREALIECLLEEKDLNIYLMSHAWEHALVSTINIVKENGISRIK